MNFAHSILNKNEVISSWNRNYTQEAKVFYPKNILDIQNLLKEIKKKKLLYIIKTGKCSYDSKSIISDIQTLVISLKNFNKIYTIKNNSVVIESGALIQDILKNIKNKNYTLYSIPGGDKISLGGAISANVIGKDSNKNFASFGDAVSELNIINNNGSIIKLKKKGDLKNFIGAFGHNGIIVSAKLILKKTKSQNVLVATKIINNVDSIIDFFNQNHELRYIQLDPFFRKKNFGIGFSAKSISDKNIYFKKINLLSNNIERIFIKLFSIFIIPSIWKIFYKIFFYLNKNKTQKLDLHNFHYNSKYKHLIPLLTKKNLTEFEIMIHNNFKKNIIDLINIIKKNNLLSYYIVVKKLYKSKNSYTYKFNNDGYSFAFAFDSKSLNFKAKKNILDFLKKRKLSLNLTKTDEFFINLKRNHKKNIFFMSLYKKMLQEKNEISR